MSAGLATVEGTALTMPFLIKVAVLADSAEKVGAAARDIAQRYFDLAERVFSPFNPESDLKRCNAAPAGMALSTSPEFLAVLELCDALHRWSHGAFDPVLAATGGAVRWPGALSWTTPPPNTKNDDAMGQQQHRLTTTVTRATAAVRVDLSAVSKGWCVDRLAEALAAELLGIDADAAATTALPGVFVEWGGDIRTVGCHPASRPWACAVPLHPAIAAALPPEAAAPAGSATIPVGRPSDSSQSPKSNNAVRVVASVDAVSAAVCSSGSYAAIRGGVTAEQGKAHLVDAAAPQDNFYVGAPGGSRLVMATVVHSSCAVADALATIVAAKSSSADARRLLHTLLLLGETTTSNNSAASPTSASFAALEVVAGAWRRQMGVGDSDNTTNKKGAVHEAGGLYRIFGVELPDGHVEELLPPPTPGTRSSDTSRRPAMPVPAVRTVSDAVRASLQARVFNHAAVVVPIPSSSAAGSSSSRSGDRLYFAAAVSSIAPLIVGASNNSGGGGSSGHAAAVMRLGIMKGTRLEELAAPLTQPAAVAPRSGGANALVITLLRRAGDTDHSSAEASSASDLHAFVRSCAAGRLMNATELRAALGIGEHAPPTDAAAASVPLSGCVGQFRWGPPESVLDVGDHRVAWLVPLGAGDAKDPVFDEAVQLHRHHRQQQPSSSSPPPPPPPPQLLQCRRGNQELLVPIPKPLVAKLSSAEVFVPMFAHGAVLTAWVPEVKGMLATTVHNVEFTSRDPPRLTFDVKLNSKVDNFVVSMTALHHRLHLFDFAGAMGQEETLIDWFSDGGNTDPAMQFMYVGGMPKTPADAAAFRFESIGARGGGAAYPVITVLVSGIKRPAFAPGTTRGLVVATPSEVDGAPIDGFRPAGAPASVTKLGSFVLT